MSTDICTFQIKRTTPPYVLFLGGALEVLGMINGVTPVATFTGMPQLPPEHSSEVCRHPLPMPHLDLDLVTKDIEDLKLPAYDKDDNAQRRSRTRPFIYPQALDTILQCVFLLGSLLHQIRLEVSCSTPKCGAHSSWRVEVQPN